MEHAVVVARLDAGLRELGLGVVGELQLDLDLGAHVRCAVQEQVVHVVDEHLLLAFGAVDVYAVRVVVVRVAVRGQALDREVEAVAERARLFEGVVGKVRKDVEAAL